MPELPEVETIARDLRGALIGQSVVAAYIVNEAIIEPERDYDPAELVGKRITRIDRRGKNLLFYFESGLAMICHLKMTGRLIVDDTVPNQGKHLHFWIQFERNRLSFYDVRKFGRICFISEKRIDRHPRLARLGPEPFDIIGSRFVSVVKARHKAIKLTLMDQEVIAGIGNIYADESLYSAGIRPTRRSSELSRRQLSRLYECVRLTLQKAIDNRGSSVDDYLDGNGRKGNFQNLIEVYGRTGAACRRCGATIKRITIGGRSTHYCPHCQR